MKRHIDISMADISSCTGQKMPLPSILLSGSSIDTSPKPPPVYHYPSNSIQPAKRPVTFEALSNQSALPSTNIQQASAALNHPNGQQVFANNPQATIMGAPGTQLADNISSIYHDTSIAESYRAMKRLYKHLVYEQECFQSELRNLQRILFKIARDKNFLLDRLLQYETISDSSEDDEKYESDADSEKTESWKDNEKSTRKLRMPVVRRRANACKSKSNPTLTTSNESAVSSSSLPAKY